MVDDERLEVDDNEEDDEFTDDEDDEDELVDGNTDTGIVDVSSPFLAASLVDTTTMGGLLGKAL